MIIIKSGITPSTSTLVSRHDRLILAYHRYVGVYSVRYVPTKTLFLFFSNRESRKRCLGIFLIIKAAPSSFGEEM